MNPWPDDYTTPPDELAAKQCWDVAMKSAGEPLGAPMLREVGRYLHWLTEENRELRRVVDDQWVEIGDLEAELDGRCVDVETSRIEKCSPNEGLT